MLGGTCMIQYRVSLNDCGLRREAVLRLEAELLQPCPDRIDVGGFRSGLDYRRDKRCEPRRRPAVFLGALGVDEIESEKRVILVLDSAIHVNAAILAGISLNGRARVHNFELVLICGHPEVVTPNNSYLRE